MKNLLLLPLMAAASLFAKDDFVSQFDGKTLNNWDGDPKFWSVKDGAITGITTKETPTRGNTFAIYTGDQKLTDFDLRIDFKIIGGNSGIQYRSFKKAGNQDGWRIGGYQADFESGDRYSGICYGEAFRGILSLRGQKTTLSLNDKGKLQKKSETFGDTNEIGKAVKKKEWNSYRIVADGFHFTHYINDVKTTELIDNDEKNRRADGLLALQLHAGPPMNVQFKSIKVKHLKK
ncbi:MAG: DUF1080 domain-containing protein [Opitutales bacterium]|nr:DUF1080 domain-containing protein [Opitutales bacterium]